MNKNLLTPFLTVLCCLIMAACVRDTDLDQASDITATPVVELNLVFFDLQPNDFFDTITNAPRLTVTDTTEIPFLNDTGTQESLLRAEFLFRFTNSISRDFIVDFRFLSEENDTAYSMQTSVIAGTVDNPRVTEFIENVEGPDILDLTMADRLMIAVTIPSVEPGLEGVLNMQSKTTYYLEVTERE